MTGDPAIAFRSELAHFWLVVFSTAARHIKWTFSYWIDVVRWPLFPLVLFATFQLAYRAAGRTEVAGANVAGFLLVGIIGLTIWTATIWSGGYAIEFERSGGTVAALFLSPASRVAVVAGYGLAGIVWLLPSVVVVLLLAVTTGARFEIGNPLAPLAAAGALLAGSLVTGFALAGLFVLSRRANLLANFLQMPVYLLAGFAVPRESLPSWLQPVAAVVPVSHGVDALRASLLSGAGLGEIGTEIGLALLTAAGWMLVGIASLRRVEHVAKQGGQLEFYG